MDKIENEFRELFEINYGKKPLFEVVTKRIFLFYRKLFRFHGLVYIVLQNSKVKKRKNEVRFYFENGGLCGIRTRPT